MKAKLKALAERLNANPVAAAILRPLRFLGKLIGHNLGLKLLSLALAILMWNYVISTNTSITRMKTVSGLKGYISGQSLLNTTYGLALLEDPLAELGSVSVQVEVSQAEFAKVNSDNVQVTLDLSGVRMAGTQEVPVKATTSFGRVVNIVPSSLQLAFEAFDSRNIPVNVELTGETASDRWYNVTRSNPSTLVIKGATSVVQSISSAYVYVDVTDQRTSFTRSPAYVLIDGEGEEIPQTMLDRSATTITVYTDVVPMKEVAIASSLEKVITGQPADGYSVVGVTIQPETVNVAAEQELLDSLSELPVEPISVEDRSESFSVRTQVSKLSSLKYISADEVYVNVSIAEDTSAAWVENVSISYIGKGEALTLEDAPQITRVYVTGPQSDVTELVRTGFAATADLTGLAAGKHSVKLSFPETAWPNVTFTPESAEIEVTVSEDGGSLNDTE